MSDHNLLPIFAQVTNSTNVELPAEYHLIANISKISGALSLLIWLFAQLPQVLENHLNQSVLGVSIAFLSCWISGDVTNLVGCLLTKALPFQTSLAAYYCFIDFILSLQYWYYTRVYPKQKVHHNFLQSPRMIKPVTSRDSSHGHGHVRRNRFEVPKHDLSHQGRSISSSRSRRRKRKSFLLKIISGSVLSGSFGKASAMPMDSNERDVPELWKAFLSSIVLFFSSCKERMLHIHYNPTIIGTICGWTSSIFYVSSRTPQIIKNYRSKSTQGISYLLFLFAMMGNTLYTTSILSDLFILYKFDQYLGDVNFETVFYAQLPFVIGSSGTVLFDSIILFQCWYYRPSKLQNESRHYLHDSSDHYQHLEHLIKLKQYPTNEPSFPGRSNSESTHFTKPDWYTNVYGSIDEPDDYSHHAYSGNQTTGEHSYVKKQGSQNYHSLNVYQQNFLPLYSPSPKRERSQLNNDRAYTDTSLLLNLALIIPPPPHYVSCGSSQGATTMKNKTGISGTFSAIARSFSQSSSMIKSPTMSTSYNNSVAASPMLSTSLIPSIVGTYSSVSKRMANDSKLPFLPSDFLNLDLAKGGSTGPSNEQ